MSSGDNDHYREIIAKAVCGKGRKFSQSTHSVTPTHKPSKVLGCWIINHDFKARKDGDNVIVEGGYEINIWHSYNKNTKTEVVTETVKYRETIPLTVLDENCVSDEFDVIVRAIQQPNCLDATISPNGQKIVVQVEKEFIAEVLGETKISVHVDPDSYVNDDFDDDNVEYELDDEEFEDLDPDFLLGEDEE